MASSLRRTLHRSVNNKTGPNKLKNL